MLQMQKIRLYYLCAPFWVACPHSCQICPNCPGFCTLDRGNKSIAKKKKKKKKLQKTKIFPKHFFICPERHFTRYSQHCFSKKQHNNSLL